MTTAVRARSIPDRTAALITPDDCIRRGRVMVPMAEVIPLNVYRKECRP